jgi:hypothetical protein
MTRSTKRDVPRALKAATTLPETPAPPSRSTQRRERDQPLPTGLEWHRFETWCASNGLHAPAASPEAVAVVALYVTYLAATGRSVATIARQLLHDREKSAE